MPSADRIIELLHDAKSRSVGIERDRFLDEACRDDTALKDQILSLLAADGASSEFLMFSPTHRPAVLPAEKPGDRIGRYKLLEQIGEGGCGVVYMAEQIEPVRRRVALKVIKLGMDTKSVIGRFEAERQALALMDHPNIAKVLDGGATDTGRPYFVMELVRGVKITDYCDENHLSTNERLTLFIQVCQAVQHAHQKGIIHRDIKPSNILVTNHDDVAVPKVIDFGIAKATSGQLTDKTVFTAFAQFIGTPAYMSPEQAQMSGLDVDTRADIYSLGVLLYELLTGRTPFDSQELLAAGLDEMRRRIREDEPAKPSTRLSTLQAIDLTTVAKRRHVESPKLIHLIRGDLDWLVMKCLEKDRTRRYETANGLALDVERHLNNEPIIARPPSTGYRFQKLVHRNKLAFAAASAITAALLLGLGVSTWMYFKAQGEKKRAQTEAAKANAVSDFLREMLGSANPDALKGSDYTVRQLLDDFSAGLANQLAGQPEVEATVRATIGRAYFRLGVTDKAQAQLERALALQRHISGGSDEPVAGFLVDYAWVCFEQGQYGRGEPFVREALEIYRKRGTGGQPVIRALWTSQRILIAQSRFTEAESVFEEAMAIACKTPATEFPEIASMMQGLADVKNQQFQFAEAESLASKAVAMHRRLNGAEHPETGWALLSLEAALKARQKLADAEAACREALMIFRKYYSPGHKSMKVAVSELGSVLKARGDSRGLEALALQRLNDASQRIERSDADTEAWIERAVAHIDLNLRDAALEDYARAIALSPEDGTLRSQLAELLVAQYKWAEAEHVLREALTLQRKSVGNEHPDVASSLHRLGNILRDSGRWSEAEAAFNEAVTMRRKLFGQENLDLANSIHDLAWVLNHNGKGAEAETLSREELAMRRKLLGNDHPDVTVTINDLAVYLIARGKSSEAEAMVRQALALQRKSVGSEHPDVAGLLHKLGYILRASGRWSEAEAAYSDAVAMRRRLLGNENLDLAISIHDLAWILHHNGKPPEAEALSREELAMRRKLLGDRHPAVANTLKDLAVYLVPQGKSSEAETLAREALSVQKQFFGDVHREVEIALASLARVLQQEGKLAEAEAVWREELAVERKLSGEEHPFVANSLRNLARVLQAEGKLAGALAIGGKVAPEDEELAAMIAAFTKTLLAENKFIEAEPRARECLTIRDKKLPDDWRTFNARGMLGASLLGQGKFTEAEPLLLSGYEGMKQREDKIPPLGKPRIKETILRLVQLYEARGQTEKAAEWQRKSTEFDQGEAEKKTAAPLP